MPVLVLRRQPLEIVPQQHLITRDALHRRQHVMLQRQIAAHLQLLKRDKTNIELFHISNKSWYENLVFHSVFHYIRNSFCMEHKFHQNKSSKCLIKDKDCSTYMNFCHESCKLRTFCLTRIND